MKKPLITEKLHCVRFIGINGVSMSGLAKWCVSSGISAEGSDKKHSPETDKLKALGIYVAVPGAENEIGGQDIVVYTSALGEKDAELIAAEKQGVPIVKRSEFLSAVMDLYKTKIAVSGSHGKTTVTAMLWEIFERAGKNPAVFLGGDYGERGNFRPGGKDRGVVIAEACEYKKNFLDLNPDVKVVLNVDDDHLESFGGRAEEIAAFRKFADGGLSVINADDYGARQTINENSVTFGMNCPARYEGRNLRSENGRYKFTLYENGEKAGDIKLREGGKYNAVNALAAAAVSRLLGISFSCVKDGIENFTGVNRRNERIGDLFGLPAYADYAHHPSEIKALLSRYGEEGKKPAVIFQPHTYSRTRILMKEFITVLSGVDKLIIYKTYPARESFDQAGDGKTLYKVLFSATPGEKSEDCLKCRAPLYAENEETLLRAISGRISGADCILFVGAGDIYEKGKELCGKFPKGIFGRAEGIKK